MVIFRKFLCKLDFERIAQRLYNTASSEKSNAYTCCKWETCIVTNQGQKE